MKTGFLLLFAASVAAYGQDAAMQAAQMANDQAMQAAQLANQQAMQATQTANEQAMQASQMSAQNSGPVIGFASRPAFSVPPGQVQPGTAVRLKSSTRHAVIYYTTDGWTPTVNSTRYTGPIRIEQSMHLQAIAVAPGYARSLLAVADYTVAGQPPVAPQAAVVTDGMLRAGTPLRLVTSSDVSSKTAQVGDEVYLRLDEDVKAGDAVAIPKGSVVEATVSAVDRSGHAGEPGDVSFEVHSLNVNGVIIPLRGGETLEGLDKVNSVRHFILIPVVGASALLIRGTDAEIKPGMTLTASVAADTPLHP
ncbi:MAG TPA: chitobiase/beta-hexosaminidase C-terminal domain-containing protein [Terracidiphilus sp.]|nr:chitobiase/beta-hexosaminidase C-terminal domain-containing protein [Terracidiphilus sp.]